MLLTGDDSVTDPLAADRPMSRHAFLQATSVGGAGIAAWSVLGGVASAATPTRGPAAYSMDFNAGWLLAGRSRRVAMIPPSMTVPMRRSPCRTP
jgi:hypothetical protein